jgi:hypothetical protein
MGGLLDKANAAKDTEPTEEPAPVKVDTTASAAPAGTTSTKGPTPDGADNAMKVSLAGWVIILVGAILSLQGGAWGFAVVAIVVVLGVGAIVQADRMRGGVSKPKLYATLAVAVLVAAGPYGLVMVFPSNANIAVTDIAIDEANDELDFAIRGSFDSVDVEILSDGDVVWTGSADMGNNLKRFNVPIAEFFDGNSEDYEGNVLKTYTVKATSSNGNTVEMDVNSKFLTRQAMNGGVQFTPYVSTNTADGTSEHEGLRVQVFVGLFADGEKPMDDGKHSYASANQRQFTGQQTYTLEISKRGSSSPSYTHPTVTIDGNVAKWVSDFSGAKSSSTQVGFVPLSGTAMDNDGFEFIERDRFFDIDDCYEFTLTVTNVNLGGDHSTTFTVVDSWDINWNAEGAAANEYPTC